MNTEVLKKYSDIDPATDQLSRLVVDSIFEVHKTIGPGFLEKIYEESLICELSDRNLRVETQKPLFTKYKHHKLKTDYKLDLVVEDRVILELKCVERFVPVHEAQILSYLKMADIELGFLVNFNSPLIKDGIKRVVLKRTS